MSIYARDERRRFSLLRDRMAHRLAPRARQTELVQHLGVTGSPLIDEAGEFRQMFASTEIEHRRHLAQIADDTRAGSRDADGNLLGAP